MRRANETYSAFSEERHSDSVNGEGKFDFGEDVAMFSKDTINVFHTLKSAWKASDMSKQWHG